MGRRLLLLKHLLDVIFNYKMLKVIDLEKAKISQAKEIFELKNIVKKLERKKNSRTSGLKRLWKLGLTTRVESYEDKESLDNDLDGDEVIVDVTAGENVEQSTKVAKNEISTADLVTTAKDVEVTSATTTLQIYKDYTAKDKGKGILVEPEKPLKKKDQIAIDEEVARKLEVQLKAEIEKEERIERDKDEANIAVVEHWDEVQAKIDADIELAQKLQTKEQEQLTDAEKARLFMEFLEKRKKFFIRKREIENRNRPPTEAQQRNLMSTHLNNMYGWKLKYLKKKSFDEIQKLFDSAMKKVNTFVDMNTEMVEERQMLEKEDDSAELKRCLEIVPEDDDDDVTIEATPLSFKPPTMVDYKIYKEGKKSYFKIIKADGNSQSYLTFRKMFKNFNRDDLEVLWSIVKERFKKTKPLDDMDNLLFQTLKTMFEHHVKENIWKYQQGSVKVLHWKLFDSCGVHYITTKNMVYYLLVEKMYPFTKNILHQMWNYVRL
nr:hypothetical protein [Tanacetum cinerariifolium]